MKTQYVCDECQTPYGDEASCKNHEQLCQGGTNFVGFLMSELDEGWKPSGLSRVALGEMKRGDKIEFYRLCRRFFIGKDGV